MPGATHEIIKVLKLGIALTSATEFWLGTKPLAGVKHAFDF
jgi:hypothetical protein